MFRSRGVAKVFYHCAEPNTAALTFDDGPFNWMDQIVDTLDAHGAKGTFFLNGRNCERIVPLHSLHFRIEVTVFDLDAGDCIYNQPEVDRVKRAFDKGHQIASHTWSHAHLNSLSKDQVSSEFSRTIIAIEKITGSAPSCTRPPYGEFNDVVEDVAAEQSQNLILWDFDSGDSSGASDAQAEGAYDNLAGRHPDTILALNHEIRQSTAYAPFMITIDYH
ncbi:hypothetical protein VNI00_006529 [Paramarasmius palmivorus]|uniref:NodB homology domain-containing protein n=1 Tax=Paramarasmius palmivorus TaxID=297713 RepID=A0AAW0D4X7_9AGAR